MGAYDLWLIPTKAEADANDTSNAERLSDDITGAFTEAGLDEALINDLSQAYEFTTVLDLTSDAVLFPAGKVLNLADREASFLFACWWIA